MDPLKNSYAELNEAIGTLAEWARARPDISIWASDPLRGKSLYNRLLDDVPEDAAATVVTFLDSIERQHSTEVFVKFLRWLVKNQEPPRHGERMLRTMMRYHKIDRVRGESREVPLSHIWDRTTFDPQAAIDVRDAIERGLNEAAANGQAELVECATVWLDLAYELGRPPRSREVSEKLKVSHQTVLNRLARLAPYMR